jgi:outer membrane protein OmpA-like peptidoglycan-associated protein
MSDGPFPVGSAEEEDTPWVSVSDLMSGLMIVFLCIAVLFMHEQEKSIAQQKEIAEQYEEVQGALADALVKKFDKDKLKNWGAELDENGLVVRFMNRSARFTQGKDQLTPGFQVILAEFFPQLVSVLRHDEFRTHVREVRIEGHTSSEWHLGEGGERQEGQTYLLNMDLSQRRAFSVLVFVLSQPDGIEGMEGDLRKWLRATGLSSSQPIPMAGSTAEDKDRSRRVEFRLVTDAEEAMSRIVEQVTGAAKQ